MPKLRSGTDSRRASSWDPHRALLVGLPGVGGPVDELFYHRHRETLLSPLWSKSGRPLEAFWVFEPSVPAELRGLDWMGLDPNEWDDLARRRAAWLAREGAELCPG
jgi:hypothetical protein